MILNDNELKTLLADIMFPGKIKESYSITFGDRAENHAGMQLIGKEAARGFSTTELLRIPGIEVIDLTQYLPKDIDKKGQLHANVIIIRNGVDRLLGTGASIQLLREVKSQHEDKKALMRGKVVNKHARWNNCYAEMNQVADFEKGKGTIISFNDTVWMQKLRDKLPELLGDKARNLVAETNHYYDVSKCGIGFHGDSERKIVICARLGRSDLVPMEFQWFTRNKPIGARCQLPPIYHGDIYVMSEKAVGYDWKKSSQITLRHAAGALKFRTIS